LRGKFLQIEAAQASVPLTKLWSTVPRSPEWVLLLNQTYPSVFAADEWNSNAAEAYNILDTVESYK
jgi:hypothetical protein